MNMKQKSSTGSRTLVFLITFLSLVVILSTPLASSAGPSGRFNVQDEKFRNFEETVRDLDLSKAQRERVRSILRSSREREKTIERELQRLLERMDRRDSWRNDALRERAEDLTAELISLHYRKVNRIFNILDRDQRRRLQWRMERFERQREYMDRRWERKDSWKERKENWKEYKEYLREKEKYEKYEKYRERFRIPRREMDRIVVMKEYPSRRARDISREQAKIMVKLVWEHNDIDFLVYYMKHLW